jgi:hypothetical protein
MKDLLTADQREAILLEIFRRYQYGCSLRALRDIVPDVPDDIICEFVDEAFNVLVDWSAN